MANELITPPCVGRIIRVTPSCGCTLTKATIEGLTPDEIFNLGNKEIYLTKAILDQKEAAMLGVPERSLATLLNSSIVGVKEDLGVDKISRQSVILPYIQRRQRSYINANYWAIKSGQAPADRGVGSVPVSAWDIVVGLPSSPFQSSLEAIERYFLPGSTMIIRSWDNTANKNALTQQYTIIRAVNADVGSVRQARITMYPNYTPTDYLALTGSQKSNLAPTNGMAESATNNVADYESYCQQQPSDLSMKIVVNWLQTSRWSFCREETYEETLKLIMQGKVNDYLKGFKHMDIAEQQKAARARHESEVINSMMFGQAIDAVNQTPNTYRQLPLISDPVNPSCPLGYKANALGIFTLLQQCNRVIDMVGNRLDLQDIFQRIYLLRRFRSAAGDRVETIDSMTDRRTAAYIYEAMSRYYKAKYDVNTVKYYKSDEEIRHDNIILWKYDIYDVREAGAKWSVFTDDYFNDMVDAFAGAGPVVGHDFSVRANNLWFIDWSDVRKGVAGTNQVSRSTPSKDTELAAYQCVITPLVKSWDLRSETWTMMVDRPERHLIYHNFGNGCPRNNFTVCTSPQS